MPPLVPRKRFKSDSPAPQPQPKRPARSAPSRRAKANHSSEKTSKASKPSIRTASLFNCSESDSDLSSPESSSSSSSDDDDEFEDVPITKTADAEGKAKAQDGKDSDQSEDEDWEDALGVHHHTTHLDEPAPVVSGDIELTLSEPTASVFAAKPDGKKGPSKIQRHIRNVTHCTHVQYLLYHNLIRNAWAEDKEVQKTLVENLTAGCWKEIEQYWRDAGIKDGPKRVVAVDWEKTSRSKAEQKGTWKESGKKGVQVYESPSANGAGSSAKKNATPSKGKDTRHSNRNQRDWGATSDRAEPNRPNLSAGEPLLRLLKYLCAYWKAKFKITAPALRKRGYLAPATLEAEIKAWRADPSHAETFGERIESRGAFRKIAETCTGSRDVGQQLFTALIRGLGIEARMVASLQPAGFGWSQAEEGKPKNIEKLAAASTKSTTSTPARPKAATNGTSPGSDDSDLSSVISISSDSEIEMKVTKKQSKARDYSSDLPYPTYWTEAISNLTHTPVSVSPLPRTLIASASAPDRLSEFYAKGAPADKAKQVFAYVVAFSSDNTAKDVTTRYLPKHQLPGRTKGVRMPIEKIPIHNKHGKVRRWEEWDWFKSVMRPYARPFDMRQPWDEVEEEGDLVPAQPAKPKDIDEEGGKETLQGYKNSAEYVLERHLKREEAIRPGAKVVRHFTTGKGDNEKKEPVYRRQDIVACKTVESWHKEGRMIKEGEQPLKHVPMRAVTVTRKREIEERERVEGGKVQQGLYAKDQTDWIIPDPIVDGKIPRNAFGNIDVYVPTMIPRGSVHIPLKGTARVCKKLKIDFAEACTGFEFGKQRAVPVLTGVVVAAENEDLVIDAWEADEAERAKKEQAKKEKLVLGLWKKFFTGLRIVERMKREYGEDVELPQQPAQEQPKKSEWDTFNEHTDFEGGFVRDEQGLAAAGFVREAEPREEEESDEMAGGFLPASQDEAARDGGLTIDHGELEEVEEKKAAETAYRTPISLQSALQQPFDKENSSENEDDLVNEEVEDSKGPDQAGQRRSTKPTSHSFRPSRSRGAKSTPTPPRKRLVASDTDDDEDNETPLSALSSPSSPPSPTTKTPTPPLSARTTRNKRKASTSPLPSPPPPPPPASASRPAPKRKAARKSDAQVKSHFFAQDEEEETDLTDGNSPRKRGGGRGRGRGKGSGRGRGKGRGRARG